MSEDRKTEETDALRGAMSRRGFLKGAGLTAAGAAILDAGVTGLNEASAAVAGPKVAGPGRAPVTLEVNGTRRKVEVEPAPPDPSASPSSPQAAREAISSPRATRGRRVMPGQCPPGGGSVALSGGSRSLAAVGALAEDALEAEAAVAVVGTAQRKAGVGGVDAAELATLQAALRLAGVAAAGRRRCRSLLPPADFGGAGLQDGDRGHRCARRSDERLRHR